MDAWVIRQGQFTFGENKSSEYQSIDDTTQTSDSNSTQSNDKNINDIDQKYLENCKIFLTDFGSNMKICNLEDDEISIYLKDNTSPIIAQENSKTNLVYVLMPMRV